MKVYNFPQKTPGANRFHSALRDLVREYCGQVSYSEALGVLEIMQHEILLWMDEDED